MHECVKDFWIFFLSWLNVGGKKTKKNAADVELLSHGENWAPTFIKTLDAELINKQLLN